MKKNLLLEILERPFLSRDEEEYNLSSNLSIEDTDMTLDSDIAIGFFDTGDTNIYSGQGSKKHKNIQMQNELIKSYRKISGTAEVADAISEIIDECIFSPGSTEILNIDFGTDIPQEVKDKFTEELKNIIQKINLNKNIYSMFMSFYIDGQLNIHCSYNESDMVGGINKISIMTPFGLNFNYTKDKWEYIDLSQGNSQYT